MSAFHLFARVPAVCLLLFLPTVPLYAQRQSVSYPSSTRIAINDELEIRVQDEPELTGWVKVSADRTVTIPLVHSILVAGLTTDEARDLIAKKLSRFVKNPEVTVFRAAEKGNEAKPAGPRKWLSQPPASKPSLPPLYPSGLADKQSSPPVG